MLFLFRRPSSAGSTASFSNITVALARVMFLLFFYTSLAHGQSSENFQNVSSISNTAGYIVFPVPSASRGTRLSLEASLEQIVGRELVQSVENYLGEAQWWFTTLNEAQLLAVKGIRGVCQHTKL